MKKIFLLLALTFSAQNIDAQKTAGISDLKIQNSTLQKEVEELALQCMEAKNRIEKLEKKCESQKVQFDSLHREHCELVFSFNCTKDRLSNRLDSMERMALNNQYNIKQNKEGLLLNNHRLSQRTLWMVCGLIILLIVIAVSTWTFLRKFKSGYSSIEEVRKAQGVLEEAQKKMQEESIKLDNQLLAVASQQIAAATQQPVGNGAEPDHSLVLKMADEIVRMEKNLSRMDSSVKGYKALVNAIARIKNNYLAQGYEIVDMLGKPYSSGLKASVAFVSDDNGEYKQDTITKIIKPQVNYNGKMIQVAQIEVTQP